MPVRNAAGPVAPGGGQMSHAGALFDPAAPEAAGPEPPLEPVIPADGEPALDLPVANAAALDPATVALVAAPAPWFIDELPAPDWDVAVEAAVCAATGSAQIAKSTAIEPVTAGRCAQEYRIIGISYLNAKRLGNSRLTLFLWRPRLTFSRIRSGTAVRAKALGLRLEAVGVDRDRGGKVAADKDRPHQVGSEAPRSLFDQHALRLKVGDHRRRPDTEDRRAAIRPVKAHDPDRSNIPLIVRKYPEIADKVTCCGIAEPAPPFIKGADLFDAFKPVIADRVERIRQIKLMRPVAALIVHIGPIIDHQSI